MRMIQFRKVTNGILVEVGCMTLVFKSNTEFLLEVGRYLDDLIKVEEEYMSKYVGVPTFNQLASDPQSREMRESYARPRREHYGEEKGLEVKEETYQVNRLKSDR